MGGCGTNGGRVGEAHTGFGGKAEEYQGKIRSG